jgi:dTDP-4-amino-4,6-dideoxygalactose transaminase
MVQGIQGDGGLTPSQRKMLNEDYKQAAQGFQSALDKYSQMGLPEQKDECKDVMAQYMTVMNQVAADLNKEKLSRQTREIQADFQALDKSELSASKLLADLDKAKNSE